MMGYDPFSLTGVASAAILTAGVMPVAIRQLRRYAMDVPNSRSSHTSETPRVGGIPIILGTSVGVIVGLILEPPLASASYNAAYIICIGAGVLGVVDDFTQLRPKIRLITQMALSSGIAFILFFNPTFVSVIMAILAVLFQVAVINATNFMDGINGMTGVIVSIAAIFYSTVAYDMGNGFAVILASVLAASTIAFLPFNIPVARTFMGDGGAYFLGAVLSMLSLVLVSQGLPAVLAIGPLALYLADTGGTLIRKAVGRESLFAAHNNHAYQRMARHIGHLKTVFIYSLVDVLLIAFAYTLRDVNSAAALATIGGMAAGCVALIRLWSTGRTE